jgi:glycosyl transferase family 87
VSRQPAVDLGTGERKLSLTRIVLPPLMICCLVIGLPIWYLGARGYVEPLLHPGKDGGDKVVFYDWADFYGAGKLVAQGEGSRIYQDAALGPEQRRVLGLSDHSTASMPFSNPPFLAVAFAPLAFVPAPIAIGLIGLAGLLLTVAAAVALKQFLRPEKRLLGLVFIAGFITLWPVGDSFALGQLSMLIFLAWLAFVAFQAEGHEVAAGVGLALLLIKPQLVVVPLALTVVQKRHRVLLAFLGAAAVLGAVSIAAYGPDFVVDYPASLMARAGWDHFEFGHAQHFYGWNGLLALAVPYGSRLHVPLLVCLDAATLAALVPAWRSSVDPSSPGFLFGSSATLLATLLIDPHLLLHDLALVALALAFSLRAAELEGQNRQTWLLAGAGMWVALFVGPVMQVNFITPLLLILFAVNIREAVRSDAEASPTGLRAEDVAAPARAAA